MNFVLRRAMVVTIVLATAACASEVPAAAPTDDSETQPSHEAASTSARPSLTDSAAAGPSAGPSLPSALQIDTLATVVTNDLVVRSLPEISDDSVIHPTYLQEGEDLFVIDGPVEADGYSWYHVVPLGPERNDDVAPEDPLPDHGWVASGTAADPWILPWNDACPPSDLEGIWWQRRLLLLACFGDDQLTLEGLRLRCTYVVPGNVDPSWLSSEFCELVPSDLPADAFDLGGTGLLYHLPGDFQITDEPASVRVTGHFDDPAATTCEEHPLVGEEPTPPELVILACRARFVATDVQLADGPSEP